MLHLLQITGFSPVTSWRYYFSIYCMRKKQVDLQPKATSCPLSLSERTGEVQWKKKKAWERESLWEAGLWAFPSAPLSLFDTSRAMPKLTSIYLFFSYRLAAKSKHKLPVTMHAIWALHMNARTSLFTNQHSWCTATVPWTESIKHFR